MLLSIRLLFASYQNVCALSLQSRALVTHRNVFVCESWNFLQLSYCDYHLHFCMKYAIYMNKKTFLWVTKARDWSNNAHKKAWMQQMPERLKVWAYEYFAFQDQHRRWTEIPEATDRLWGRCSRSLRPILNRTSSTVGYLSTLRFWQVEQLGHH